MRVGNKVAVSPYGRIGKILEIRINKHNKQTILVLKIEGINILYRYYKGKNTYNLTKKILKYII